MLIASGWPKRNATAAIEHDRAGKVAEAAKSHSHVDIGQKPSQRNRNGQESNQQPPAAALWLRAAYERSQRRGFGLTFPFCHRRIGIGFAGWHNQELAGWVSQRRRKLAGRGGDWLHKSLAMAAS